MNISLVFNNIIVFYSWFQRFCLFVQPLGFYRYTFWAASTILSSFEYKFQAFFSFSEPNNFVELCRIKSKFVQVVSKERVIFVWDSILGPKMLWIKKKSDPLKLSLKHKLAYRDTQYIYLYDISSHGQFCRFVGLNGC